jgi:AcrR family transcriptional regulator
MALVRSSGLRERKKAALRSDLVEAAMALFLERGFHGTLVDDIADAAGISRRTFFHYFPAKQDVIVDWFRQQGEYLAGAFSARPTSETIWSSLLAAFIQMHDFYGKDDRRVIELRRMIHLEPALLAKKYDFYVFVAQILLPAVKRRLGVSKQSSLVAHVLVQAAIGAYNATNGEWALRSGSRSFNALARRAFALAEPAISRYR